MEAKKKLLAIFFSSFFFSFVLLRLNYVIIITNIFKTDKFVGIDVAKGDFYACFEENGESEKFDNSKEKINKFFRILKQKKFDKKETTIGLESTASYHLELCVRSFERGFAIKIINPLIVKKQNQTNLRRVKNDKKDAGLIRYCVANGAGYGFEMNKDSIIVKSIVRQRNSLANSLLKMKKQIEDVTYKENCFDVKISSVYEDMSVILKEKMKELEKRLKLFRRDEQKLLESIPGVGPLTAVSFISEVGNIKKFSNAKKLVAFVGLDSRVHQSGTSVRGKGYISKRGNKILRTRLYNACSVAVLRPNIFQRYFQKKRSEGKPYRVALVATMNKMTHVIFSVWTNKRPFEEKQNQDFAS